MPNSHIVVSYPLYCEQTGYIGTLPDCCPVKQSGVTAEKGEKEKKRRTRKRRREESLKTRITLTRDISEINGNVSHGQHQKVSIR